MSESESIDNAYSSSNVQMIYNLCDTKDLSLIHKIDICLWTTDSLELTVALAVAMTRDEIMYLEYIYDMIEIEHKEKKLVDAFKCNINNTYTCIDFYFNLNDRILMFVYNKIGYDSFIDMLAYKNYAIFSRANFTLDSFSVVMSELKNEDKLKMFTISGGGNGMIVALIDACANYNVIIHAIKNIPASCKEQIVHKSARSLLSHCFSFDDNIDDPHAYMQMVCSLIRIYEYKYVYVRESYNCFVNSAVVLIVNNENCNSRDELIKSVKDKLYQIFDCFDNTFVKSIIPIICKRTNIEL